MNNDREYDILLDQILNTITDLERKYKCRSYEIVDFVNLHTTHRFYYKDVSLLKSHKKKHFHSSAKRGKLKALSVALTLMSEQKEEESKVLVYGDIEKDVLNAVHIGLGHEFGLYKSVPDIESSLRDLQTTHHMQASAYKRLVEIVNRNIELGWIMSNLGNPSQFKIIDSIVLDLKPNQAHIRTKEYWLLSWYDPNIQDYVYEYENENDQTYILNWYASSGWLIETNNYNTYMGKIPPKSFKPEIYADLNLTKEGLIQKVQEFIGSGSIESGIEMVYAYSEKSGDRDLMLDLITLRGSLYSLMKQRNLNQISLDDYQSTSRTIARELYQIVDSIILKNHINGQPVELKKVVK